MNDAETADFVGAPIPAKSIHFCRTGGLGDVLMCTPALREFKRTNPECQINFYTAWPDVVEGLSYINVVSRSVSRPPHLIWMGYENAIPSGKHLAEILGDSIGVNVKDVRPDCVVAEELVLRYKNSWRASIRPHVLVQRRAGSWTPNKDWPNDHWERLIHSLSNICTVIEIGYYCSDHKISESPNYIDLRGKTDLKELIACVAAADVLVAPDSGPIHIAAATKTPTVLIMGGYIIPENTAYSGNRILYTPISCSPCWLRTPCPIDRECLRKIEPETVEHAIMDIWRDSASARDKTNWLVI